MEAGYDKGTFKSEKNNMKLVVQRVHSASVKISDQIVANIREGLLVFIGIHQDDTEAEIEYLFKKLINLRIFEDENGKMNLSLTDVKGSMLVVSQFTLYANCNRGNRPDFISAAKPEKAKDLYMKFVEKIRECGIPVETGIFGADMQVSLVNDGPVTIIL